MEEDIFCFWLVYIFSWIAQRGDQGSALTVNWTTKQPAEHKSNKSSIAETLIGKNREEKTNIGLKSTPAYILLKIQKHVNHPAWGHELIHPLQ